jgi:hypothetical protein
MHIAIIAISLLLFVVLIVGGNLWRLRESNSMYRHSGRDRAEDKKDGMDKSKSE